MALMETLARGGAELERPSSGRRLLRLAKLALVVAIVSVGPSAIATSDYRSAQTPVAHLKAQSWETDLSSYESSYCLQENDTYGVTLGGSTSAFTNATVIDLLPEFGGTCAGTSIWRLGEVFEEYTTGTLKSVVFLSVNNTTTTGEWNAGQSKADVIEVGLYGGYVSGTYQTWVNYSDNASQDNGIPDGTLTQNYYPGGGGPQDYYDVFGYQYSGNYYNSCSCTCDIWDGMYFDDLYVSYPPDDVPCYDHSNSATWWADGNAMTHFVFGSGETNLLNSLGPGLLGAAIGAAIGAQGGWGGAAAGAILGGAIGAFLVYGASNVWIDENNSVWWWSNQAFFTSLHNTPIWAYVSPAIAGYYAKVALGKLTYFRVGNTDYANTNAVGNPT